LLAPSFSLTLLAIPTTPPALIIDSPGEYTRRDEIAESGNFFEDCGKSFVAATPEERWQKKRQEEQVGKVEEID